MYRIVIKRCEKDNVLTGRARYRVVECYEVQYCYELQFDGWKKVAKMSFSKKYGILLPKPRQINSFINPAKAMFPPNKKGVKA